MTETSRGEPLASFIAYVEGETEVNETISRVHALTPQELQEVFEDHRAELREIDPAREAILDGLYGSLQRRPRKAPPNLMDS